MAAPNENRALPTGAPPAGTGRRKLLLTGAPLVLTLASRPALGAVCTGSAAASFLANQSSGDPYSNQTCAFGPGCWKLRADREGSGAWLGTSYTRSQLFSDVFGGPGLAIVGDKTWRANPPTATLYDALNFGVTIEYVKNSGKSFFMTNGASFAAEAVAALLNASFDEHYNNNFDVSASAVLSTVKSLWAYQPQDSGNDGIELNTQVNNRRDSFAALHDGDCDIGV